MAKDISEFKQNWLSKVAETTVNGPRKIMGTNVPDGAYFGQEIAGAGRDACAWLQWRSENDDEFNFGMVCRIRPPGEYSDGIPVGGSFGYEVFDSDTGELVHTEVAEVSFDDATPGDIAKAFAHAIRVDGLKFLRDGEKRQARRIKAKQYDKEMEKALSPKRKRQLAKLVEADKGTLPANGSGETV